VVDEVLVRSPVPMVIARTATTTNRPPAVRGPAWGWHADGHAEDPLHGLLRSFGRVLVPVNGTPASRAGEELAGGLAAACRLPTVLTHVLTRDVPVSGRTRRSDTSAVRDGGRSIVGRRSLPLETGRQILTEAAGSMAPLGVRTRRMIRHGTDAGAEIVAAAAVVVAAAAAEACKATIPFKELWHLLCAFNVTWRLSSCCGASWESSLAT
jgi:hypothetical protein